MSENHDLEPAALENMRRIAFDRSKWLQTCTYEVAKYEYNREELNQFYDELRDIVGRVKAKIICKLCSHYAKKCYVLPCGCFFCGKCTTRSWNKEKQSTCPNCKITHGEPATPFYAMDTITNDMNSFLKEAKYFQTPNSDAVKSNESQEAIKRLKSMNFVLLQRLKNIESGLMCDFCFTRIKQTFLVNCSSNAFTFRPFCKGCDAKYIKFFEKEQGRFLRESFQFEIYDDVVTDFCEFMDKMVEYSKTSKVPTRFLSSGAISFLPIYKMLFGFAIVGVVLLYYSF